MLAEIVTNPSNLPTVNTGVFLGVGAILIWLICLVNFKLGFWQGSLANSVWFVVGLSILIMTENCDSMQTRSYALVWKEDKVSYGFDDEVYLYPLTLPSEEFSYAGYVIYEEKFEEEMSEKYGRKIELPKNFHRFGEEENDGILENELVYAMHDPLSEDYWISPWIFNPKSLVYIPLITGFPGLILGYIVASILGKVF